ncbi:MAG: hypothetical protein ACRBFS_20935 [Aureispira sp.]
MEKENFFYLSYGDSQGSALEDIESIKDADFKIRMKETYTLIENGELYCEIVDVDLFNSSVKHVSLHKYNAAENLVTKWMDGDIERIRFNIGVMLREKNGYLSMVGISHQENDFLRGYGFKIKQKSPKKVKS